MTRISGTPNLEKTDVSTAAILDEVVEDSSTSSKYHKSEPTFCHGYLGISEIIIGSLGLEVCLLHS